MDVKLEDLIAKIKKDGIEEANKTAGEIIQKAELKAKAIIEEAKNKALELEKEAKASAVKLENNAKASLKQAARDLTLALKGELTVLFDRILKGNTGEALTPEFMSELIAKIINKREALGGVTWEVLVSKTDKEKLEKLLLGSFKKQAQTTIEIKINKAIDKGFRIGIKGQNLHYDFTDQSILEALKEFLNPSLRAILDTNNGNDK